MRRSPWRPAIAWKIGSVEAHQSLDTRSAAATSRVGSQAIMSCGGRHDGIGAVAAIAVTVIVVGAINKSGGRYVQL